MMGAIQVNGIAVILPSYMMGYFAMGFGYNGNPIHNIDQCWEVALIPFNTTHMCK